MIIYIIIALCLLSFALLSEFGYFKKSKIAKTIFLSIGSFILFFVSAFRFDVGNDYPPYTQTFVTNLDKTLEQLSTMRMEKGYLLLNRYIQLFTSNFQYIFIITSLLVVLLLSIFLYKHSKNPSFGLLMFYLFGFYFNSMNFLRNVIAALIIIFAYKYIKDKSFIRFIVLVLLASAFHISALIFIPFYFIFKLKFNYITVIGYTVVCGLIFYFSVPIMEFITKYIYTNYDPMTSTEMFNGIPSLYSWFIFVVLVCGLLLRKDLNKYYEWNEMLIAATYLDFYFGFLGSKHAILSRFAIYYGPIMSMLMVPNIIVVSYNNIKNKSDKNIVYRIRSYFCLIVTLLASIGFFICCLYYNYNDAIPHQWIWDVYHDFSL